MISADCVGRVLVVDDDRKNRQLLRDLLCARGHEVVEAENGEEALRMVAETRPDAVLLDVMMSGLDGFEVCRQLKSDPATASTPVLLVTALTDRKDRLRGIDVGANDFITKPIDSREVMLRTRNAIHLKQLHDELQVSYEKLRHLESLRENLTRWLIHDMKAPLGGILGYLELIEMEDNAALTEAQRGYTTEAFSATQRLLRMVNSVLDVSRLAANKMPLTRQPCRLDELVARTMDVVGPLAREKDVALILPSAPVTAVCDSEVILRIFTNLIENALKYVPQGGEVRVTLEQDNDGVRAEITDNGPGIPPEYHKKIFEVFGQVEIRRARKMFSTGLGLAFCKLAVEAHGGSIGVTSPAVSIHVVAGEKGGASARGSTFWFTLPSSSKETS